MPGNESCTETCNAKNVENILSLSPQIEFFIKNENFYSNMLNFKLIGVKKLILRSKNNIFGENENKFSRFLAAMVQARGQGLKSNSRGPKTGRGEIKHENRTEYVTHYNVIINASLVTLDSVKTRGFHNV